MISLTLDLRLGAAGIITRREQQRSPAAKVMLDKLRHAAKLQSGPSTTKARRKIGNRK